jgi:hypothetical protein
MTWQSTHFNDLVKHKKHETSGDELSTLGRKYYVTASYDGQFLIIKYVYLFNFCGPGSSIGIATELRAERSGD